MRKIDEAEAGISRASLSSFTGEAVLDESSQKGPNLLLAKKKILLFWLKRYGANSALLFFLEKTHKQSR